ncbi:CHASE3 domain-containing protein [Pedobacter sp. UBA5917]|jgi:CHASE3 domain sensor protein|uniref:CHASE3 domain-containing protein n=1 Tax=Pedobacter sp. UBA5917 TaxID=1947061 RepID=UPI0025F5CA23|nr:CHASE3 domain-containing protein [Pedobacter sp. UBA5917]
MKTSFINRPSAGFIVSVFLTLVTSALSWFSVQQFFASERWVDHTNTVKQKLEMVISSMKDAETGQRGFLLTGNEKFLEPYNGAEKLVKSAFDTVRVLTQDNTAQQSEFKGLKEMIDAKFDLLRTTIDQKRSGGTISLDILLLGKSYMDRTRVIITRMENREDTLLAIRLSTLNLYGIFSLTSIVVAFLISMGSTIYFYNRTVRNYEDRLRLEEELKSETASIEKRVKTLKDLSKRVGDGEYGIKINPEDLR